MSGSGEAVQAAIAEVLRRAGWRSGSVAGRHTHTTLEELAAPVLMISDNEAADVPLRGVGMTRSTRGGRSDWPEASSMPGSGRCPRL